MGVKALYVGADDMFRGLPQEQRKLWPQAKRGSPYHHTMHCAAEGNRSVPPSALFAVVCTVTVTVTVTGTAPGTSTLEAR